MGVFLDCAWDFWRSFWGPGPEAPGDIRETFSASRAWRGRETCFDTEYDRAKAPSYNGNDVRPPLVV